MIITLLIRFFASSCDDIAHGQQARGSSRNVNRYQ